MCTVSPYALLTVDAHVVEQPMRLCVGAFSHLEGWACSRCEILGLLSSIPGLHDLDIGFVPDLSTSQAFNFLPVCSDHVLLIYLY